VKTNASETQVLIMRKNTVNLLLAEHRIGRSVFSC